MAIEDVSLRGVLGWKLLDKKTIPSTSPVETTTFSNLNLTADEEYHLRWNLRYSNGSSSFTAIRPNNQTTNFIETHHMATSQTTHVCYGGGGRSAAYIANPISAGTGTIYGEGTISQISGYGWMFRSRNDTLQPNGVLYCDEWGWANYQDTSNITSIVFLSLNAGCNFYGWIELYAKGGG